jgi:hypothetical protein
LKGAALDRFLLTKYLKATISCEGVQRVETWPVPQDALRKVLLSAIAHKATNVAAFGENYPRNYSEQHVIIVPQSRIPDS